MLAQAKTKSTAGLALGDACLLPVATSVVDAATVGWGIRNVPDIDAAHAEIARVLCPGGRFVSIDMAQPRNPLVRAVSKLVFNTVVPRLGALFGKTEAYRYLPKSTERFSSREQLAASMERAGLTDVRFTDLFFGNLCIHYGRKP
jgi:demethylmenaquinone methyltransferase/2-methoxy-6-polyprenyl-1,4-benzoquinol methylase